MTGCNSVCGGKSGTVMVLIDEPGQFFEDKEQKLFYVGFLRSEERWFPLSYSSEPELRPHLDTLFISPSQAAMKSVLDSYRAHLQGVEQTFIQFLLPEEIMNLLEMYGLDRIAVVEEGPGGGSCDCGCGCG